MKPPRQPDVLSRPGLPECQFFALSDPRRLFSFMAGSRCGELYSSAFCVSMTVSARKGIIRLIHSELPTAFAGLRELQQRRGVGCGRTEKSSFPSPTGCGHRFRGWNLDFPSLADECRGTDHAGGSNPFLREIQRPGRRSRGIRTVTAASSLPEIGAGIRRLSPPIRLELLRGGIENCGCCTQLKLLFRKIDEPEDFLFYS